MNITLKLPDELVRKARHQAIDENTSLSALEFLDETTIRIRPIRPITRPS